MFGLEPINLAFILIVTGLSAFGLIRLLMRAVERKNPIRFPMEMPDSGVDLAKVERPEDGVIIVQAGGTVLYANQTIRGWLNLQPEDLPNLEHLANRCQPSESFLKLCSETSQERFSVQGLLVDGASYPIPYANAPAFLVALKRPDLSLIGSAREEISGTALEILGEITRTMTSQPTLESTLESIVNGVERLISADLYEITVWDPKKEALIPFGYTGLPGTEREFVMGQDLRHPGRGISGFLFDTGKPLLVPDSETADGLPEPDGAQQIGRRSFLGVPLMLKKGVLGTLELGSSTPNSFNDGDLTLLQILADQAAVALEHAQIRTEESKRVSELSGLANLSQAVVAIGDRRDLYTRLIESILPLLPVERLGFLIHSESIQTLQAQAPFIGIPDSFVALYTSEIQTGSPAELIIKDHKIILAPNAPEDEVLETLGLAHLAQAAGIRNSVLIPLTVGERSLGYLQAANKKDGTDFEGEDLRILSIIAGQSAPIIENAGLIEEARRRTRQAEALRQISNLAGGDVNFDQTLKYSVVELTRLLDAQRGLVFLMNEDTYTLELHSESNFGFDGSQAFEAFYLSAHDRLFASTAVGSLSPVSFASSSGGVEQEEFYQSLAVNIQTENLVSIPLVVRDHAIGEIVIGRERGPSFSQSEIAMAVTAAGQIAEAIHRVLLFQETDKNLRSRVEKLTAITRINREINASTELEELLSVVHKELLLSSGADCGSIVLFELSGAQLASPVLSTRIGDPVDENLEHFESAFLAQTSPLLINDFVDSGYPPAHEQARSAVVLPIRNKNRSLGLIHLHSRSPNQFNQESLEHLNSIATQTGIAIGNARRFQDQVRQNKLLQLGLDSMAKLLRTTRDIKEKRTIVNTLESISTGILDSTPFQHVVISLFDQEESAYKRAAEAGNGASENGRFLSHTVSSSSIEDLLKPEFRLRDSYFIPKEGAPYLPPDLNQPDSSTFLLRENQEADWQPEDLLLTPLYREDHTPLGLIQLDAPRHGLRPDRTTIEALDIFAIQTALAIEDQATFTALVDQVDDLQQEVERAHELTRNARLHLPVLLQKDIEQTLAVQTLKQRSNWI